MKNIINYITCSMYSNCRNCPYSYPSPELAHMCCLLGNPTFSFDIMQQEFQELKDKITDLTLKGILECKFENSQNSCTGCPHFKDCFQNKNLLRRLDKENARLAAL